VEHTTASTDDLEEAVVALGKVVETDEVIKLPRLRGAHGKKRLLEAKRKLIWTISLSRNYILRPFKLNKSGKRKPEERGRRNMHKEVEWLSGVLRRETAFPKQSRLGMGKGEFQRLS